ncbi:unnamed protein product [Closterium sp. NIES-65]|nr:unnamed protein product [Closterium sp. NIES-65]
MGIKASWKKTGVTIASDMMTDKCGRLQANVLLVNDAGAVLKECVDCNMEKKTGGYIAGILKPVVEEVGPENVVAFCMDGGSNYASACRKLIKMWPHIQQVPCATHVMDLMMEDVGKMGWAKKMVVSDEWKVWAAGSRKEVAEKFAAQVLDTAWWKTAEFFTKLMQLPFKAMRMTDGEAKGMMGRIYDVMLQLTEDVEALVDADEEQLCISDKKQICRILKDRWDESLACAMHVAGRILNPANQEEDIFGGDAECTRVFKAFLHQHAGFLVGHDGKGRDAACDYLVELGDGLRDFLDMKGSFGMAEAVAQREMVKAGKYSMVKWWQWNGTDAPRLASLAIRILSQPVSVSPCERGWSSWESVHTARRNRLGSAKCADLVFVAHNWNVVRNWHTRKDVMPNVVCGNESEHPIPEGYNVLDEQEEEEEEGEDEDAILEDEYE